MLRSVVILWCCERCERGHVHELRVDTGVEDVTLGRVSCRTYKDTQIPSPSLQYDS